MLFKYTYMGLFVCLFVFLQGREANSEALETKKLVHEHELERIDSTKLFLFLT